VYKCTGNVINLRDFPTFVLIDARQIEGATGQTGQPVSLVPIRQTVFILGFIAFSRDSGSILIF